MKPPNLIKISSSTPSPSGCFLVRPILINAVKTEVCGSFQHLKQPIEVSGSHSDMQYGAQIWSRFCFDLRCFVSNYTLRPTQNGRHVADDIFNCIFLNEKSWFSTRISSKYASPGLIDNGPALVEIMAWYRMGVKPLFEPMVVYYTHYDDVMMSAIASQITTLTIVYSTVYSGEDQRKYQSSASLAFVQEIRRWPVNSPLKRPVTRKIFHFDDVIMRWWLSSHQARMCKNPQSCLWGIYLWKLWWYHTSNSKHIEAETNWPPFRRRHFQTHFLEWKLSYFNSNFTEICSQRFNCQYANIGSDNGLARSRPQAIMWTKDGLVYWRIYESLVNKLLACNPWRVYPSVHTCSCRGFNVSLGDNDSSMMT